MTRFAVITMPPPPSVNNLRSVRGVNQNKDSGTWSVYFKGAYMGSFKTREEAVAARERAEVEFCGSSFQQASIVIDGGVAKVPLFGKNGKVTGWALIDAADADNIGKYRWCRTSNGYAATGNGKILMHRLMCECGASVVDHIDGDKLNNRRANLRVCDQSENGRNRRGPNRNGTSGYIGVYRGRGKWFAKLTAKGKQYHLGYYDTAEEAARARDAGARKIHGEFATLNFPNAPGVEGCRVTIEQVEAQNV